MEYASEEDCQQAIEQHREGQSDNLALIAHRIASGLARTWRDCPLENDDMAQEAVIEVLRRARGYVPGRGKAFAYLTQIVKFNFCRQCRDARRRLQFQWIEDSCREHEDQ